MSEIDRHKLIKEEFRSILSSQENLNTDAIEAIKQTDAIVALSAAPIKEANGEIIEDSPENVARVDVSIELIYEVTARRLNKSISDLTDEDVVKHGPHLVLDGETEQLNAMMEIAKSAGFPGKIVGLDCGKRGEANTKTQFQAINTDLRFANTNHLTFVTSDYHIPRVSRTAAAQLTPRIYFDVIAVPHDRYHEYDVYKTVKGEVERIVKYSQTGDIATSPKRSS